MKRAIIVATLVAFSIIITGFSYDETGPYTNDRLHKWACDTVFGSEIDDGSGCYDICFAAAGGYRDDKTGEYVLPRESLDDKYSKDLQNACAIIFNGADW